MKIPQLGHFMYCRSRWSPESLRKNKALALDLQKQTSLFASTARLYGGNVQCAQVTRTALGCTGVWTSSDHRMSNRRTWPWHAVTQSPVSVSSSKWTVSVLIQLLSGAACLRYTADLTLARGLDPFVCLFFLDALISCVWGLCWRIWA